MNTIKNKLKTAGILAVTIPTLACGNYLKEKDFENPDIWKSYYNSESTVWKAYMNEDISHNSDNWYTYCNEVNGKNPQGLNGTIHLPDLDGDGKVGN